MISSVFVFLMGVGAALYGCGRARSVLYLIDAEVQVSDKSALAVAAFVVPLVIVLISMFDIPDVVTQVFRVGFMAVSVRCIAGVLCDAFLIVRSGSAMGVSVVLAVLLAVIGLVTEHWVISNFVTFCICVEVICVFTLDSLGGAFSIAVVVLIYDICLAFLQWIPSETGVINAALTSKLSCLPVWFVCPSEGGSVKTLGSWDIQFAGIVMNMAMRFDGIHGSSVFVATFIGYVVGLALLLIAELFGGGGVPEALCVLPPVFVALMSCAHSKDLLSVFWQHGASAPETTLEPFTPEKPEAERASDTEQE